MSRATCGKRHYELAAAGLRDLPPRIRRECADALASIFEADNPLFDRGRWYEAAEKGLVRCRPNARPHAMRSGNE